MSDSREPSYYEIVLSNRQVVAVFVVLLVCVLVAFLSGVWIGRKGPAAPVMTAAGQSITAGSEPGEPPLEELRFFSPRDPDQEVSAPPTKAPAAPPKGGAAEPVAAIEPVPEPEAAPVAAAPEQAQPPAGAEARSGPPAEPAKPAAAPQPVASGLVVQVFSSTDREQAESVAKRLVEGGYPALLSPIEFRGRTMYRVRVGPYAERDEALAVAARVRKDFRLDTWITE